MKKLAAVVHGESGSGKSYFGGTAPGKKLILDAEGGSGYVRANLPSITWNPSTESPPDVNGDWNSCIVDVLKWNTFYNAYQWLASGQHPFDTVIIDSLTEVQKRLIDDIAGVDQPSLQDWGTIGRNMEDIIRKFRDLIRHPVKPLHVIMLCLSHLRDNETRPFLKGQLELTLPAFVDIVGYLYTQASTTEGNQLERFMQIGGFDNIIAKDRTDVLTKKYGTVIQNANFSDWLDLLDIEFGNPVLVSNEVTE